jgi:hypothetical protein
MLGCQSDRTTFPNHVEELFKLYYNQDLRIASIYGVF